MRYLFYYRTEGAIIFKYKDDFGNRLFRRYIFYTLKEAISQFRKNNNLQHKHIKIQKLY